MRHKTFPDESVLVCVDEVICLQEINHLVLDDALKDFSWDEGQADGSVVPRVCEEGESKLTG